MMQMMRRGETTPETWLVVAPHEEPPWGSQTPWGLAHIRKDGELMTACGVNTIGWKVFWMLRFPLGVPTPCPDCREALAAQS
ncbi:hypothetical protein [Nocardioides sp.]|uniref:hypothetical protein n=1 Tax=Nocardioides sp. TaxID=35761 RepID=UPI0035B4E3B0